MSKIIYDVLNKKNTVSTDDSTAQVSIEEQKEITKNSLRLQRQIECFPIINRGQMWYASLTETQLAELNTWYQAWLNVTETLLIPEKPIWLE